MPVIQSPAGPMAVRSPSFAIAGFTVFSLRELSRTQFTLNKVIFKINPPIKEFKTI
jgi:actin-binding protein anillin